MDPGLASSASVAHPWVPGIHLYLFWDLHAGVTGEISACMDVGDQISGSRAVRASRLPTEPSSTPAFSLDAPANCSTKTFSSFTTRSIHTPLTPPPSPQLLAREASDNIVLFTYHPKPFSGSHCLQNEVQGHGQIPHSFQSLSLQSFLRGSCTPQIPILLYLCFSLCSEDHLLRLHVPRF